MHFAFNYFIFINVKLLFCFNLYINLACLTVRLYPINVKAAEPIGPKFFVGIT